MADLDIARIVAQADLPAIARSSGELRINGQEYKIKCPFHDPDNNPSCSIFNKGQKWQYKCFSCGESGDALDWVQKVEGLDLPQALKRLQNGAWVPFPAEKQSKPKKPDRTTSKPPADAPAPSFNHFKFGNPSKVWAYHGAKGELLGYVARYEREDGGKDIVPWTWGARGDAPAQWDMGQWNVPRPLYGLDVLAAETNKPVLIVEGEKACDAARELLGAHYVVVTWPGGSEATSRADWKQLEGRSVTIWPDADEPGKKCAAAIAETLHRLACPKIRIVNPDGAAECWDLADALADGWTTEKTIAWAKPRAVDYPPKNQPTVAPPAAPQPPNSAKGNGVLITNVGLIIPQPIRWLWKGRIPSGKVSMIAGDPGLGKSQVCASLASIVSNGGMWPVDRTSCEGGEVIMMSAEDDAADTIRPRLEAAGADVSRVHLIQGVRSEGDNGQLYERTFNMGEDMARLRAVLNDHPHVRMVIIDPVSAYLGTLDSHKNAEVRAMLAPLAVLASETNVAIILVSHLTKGQSQSVLARIQGSMAFGAAARAVWGVTKDHGNPSRRLFMPMKNNLGKDDSGLAYSIEACRLDAPEDDEPIETSRVIWEANAVTTSVEEAFANHLNDEERSSMADAKDFLRGLLQSGPMSVNDIRKDSDGAGYSWSTIRRAQAALKIHAEKAGYKAGWIWALPAAPETPI